MGSNPTLSASLALNAERPSQEVALGIALEMKEKSGEKGFAHSAVGFESASACPEEND